MQPPHENGEGLKEALGNLCIFNTTVFAALAINSTKDKYFLFTRYRFLDTIGPISLTKINVNPSMHK